MSYKIRDFIVPLRALISELPFPMCLPVHSFHVQFRTLAVRNPLFRCFVGLGPGRRQACLTHNASTSCLPRSGRFLLPTPARSLIPSQDLETPFGEDINTSEGSMSEQEVNSKAVGFPWKRLWVLLLRAMGTRWKHSLVWLMAFFWFSQMLFTNLNHVNPNSAGNMWP